MTTRRPVSDERVSVDALRCSMDDIAPPRRTRFDDLPPISERICKWCGEPGTPDNPLRETMVGPPVEGYPTEPATVHEPCGHEAATALVR